MSDRERATNDYPELRANAERMVRYKIGSDRLATAEQTLELLDHIDRLRSSTTWETREGCGREKPVCDMEAKPMGTRGYGCWECE